MSVTSERHSSVDLFAKIRFENVLLTLLLSCEKVISECTYNSLIKRLEMIKYSFFATARTLERAF